MGQGTPLPESHFWGRDDAECPEQYKDTHPPYHIVEEFYLAMREAIKQYVKEHVQSALGLYIANYFMRSFLHQNIQV